MNQLTEINSMINYTEANRRVSLQHVTQIPQGSLSQMNKDNMIVYGNGNQEVEVGMQVNFNHSFEMQNNLID